MLYLRRHSPNRVWYRVASPDESIRAGVTFPTVCFGAALLSFPWHNTWSIGAGPSRASNDAREFAGDHAPPVT